MPNSDMRPHEPITFFKKDLVLNEEARVTTIVLEVGMTNEGIYKYRVKRVLIHTWATKNIFYFKSFKEMGMNDIHLKPSNMILETHKIIVKGTARIKVTLGSDICTKEEEIKFYVIDIDSPYKAILRTPAYVAFELIVSMSRQQVMNQEQPQEFFGVHDEVSETIGWRDEHHEERVNLGN